MAEPADVQANRMDLVSRWADDIAHEIKNPLHAMVINLELVKRRAGSPEAAPLVERVEVLESELHRVHNLIEALLRLVRPWSEHGFAEAERVFRDLRPIVEVRARIRKVEFQQDVCDVAVAIPGGRLTLILLNLIDHAVDHTPAGGRISTTCGLDDERVRMTIRHTADPVSPEPEQGGGPGLAIARRLVEEARGELTSETTAGGADTLLTVLLPRADAA